MIADRIKGLGVVPVVTIAQAAEAGPLGDALVAGGLPCVEVTLRTEAALDGLKKLASRDDLLAGAGTVLSIKQAEMAVGAGAEFLVSPGLNPGVVRWALEHDIPIFPGVSSATEIEAALNLGLKHLKFFPAEPLGGVKLIKALSKPFHMVSFMPTGGIGKDNLAGYLSEPFILACGGSWMVKGDWIREGDFLKIKTAVEEAVQLIKIIKSGVS